MAVIGSLLAMVVILFVPSFGPWMGSLGLVCLVALACMVDRTLVSQVRKIAERLHRLSLAEESKTPPNGVQGNPFDELRAALLGVEAIWERREIRLRETEAKYRTLLGQVPAVAYVASLDPILGRVIISPQVGRLLGFSAEEWLSSPDLWLRHIHPDDRGRVLEQIRQAHSTGEPLSSEYRMLDRYGRVLWFRDEARVVKDRDGRPQFLQGLLLDTSERKRAEEALRESEERFRKIVDTAHEGIWVVGVGGKTIYVNQRMAQMLGMSLQEILGSSLEEFLWEKTAGPAPLACEAGSHREVALRRKDGSVLWALVASSPLANGTGETIGTLHMLADISERKQMEEQLRESGERLRLLASHLEKVREEERTWIAREIHDELGQGLTALKLELSSMERKLAKLEVPPEQRETLKEKIRQMLSSVDTTIKAVRDICTKLRPAVLDNLGLEAAIEWQLSEFEKRTGIICTFTPWDCEPTLSTQKTTALFRIFQELLTNAARHSGASRIEARLSTDANFVILELQDNGCGLKEETISEAGGLGLLGIRERVALLGGDIALEGPPGQGTRAVVRVPIEGREATIEPSPWNVD